MVIGDDIAQVVEAPPGATVSTGSGSSGSASVGAAPADGDGVTASDRAGTVRVRATAAGVPVRIEIDESLVCDGAHRLAETVLAVCTSAASAAHARQRGRLAQAGVDDGLLGRLGLPGRDALADTELSGGATHDAPGGEPLSWLSRA